MRVAVCCTALAAAMSAPACDVRKKNVCDDFCNYRCGLQNSSESGQPHNITLWRLTPTNVTGLRNKDTGDAPGDISYFLEKLSRTKDCRQHPSDVGCFNEFGSAIYGQFTVEVDGQYGPYLMCNPTRVGSHPGRWGPEGGWKDSREFQCGQSCLFPTKEHGCGKPWYKRNGTSRHSHGVSCWCDTSQRELKTVGRQPMPDSSGSQNHSFSWRSLGGYWYSTPMISECPEGAPLGTNGCTWRIVKSIYRNASCVNGKLNDAVEKYGAACFDKCSKPLNRTGDCYLDCYKDVLQGNNSIPRMSDKQILDPWRNAFDHGGCPTAHPSPCEGKQCEPPTSGIDARSVIV